MINSRSLVVFLLLLLSSISGYAQEAQIQFDSQTSSDSFAISDIRVEGLQRISATTVFANLPVNIQDTVTPELRRECIRRLFATGNFSNVELGRDGDVLVVVVQERPSIASINIEGNKQIKTEQLVEGLSTSGLAEGRVFKRSTMEGIRQEILRQYVNQGRYDANIIAEVEPLPRNRVDLHIDVDEGTVAKIKHINIVGNERFATEDLLELFEMHASNWKFWSSGDKYGKERLRGDLEKLESFYRDQGFLKFQINSTQVAMSPERDAIFITINVSEGDIYSVSEIKLSGELKFPEDVMRRLVALRAGEIYSQRKVTITEEVFTKVLGNDGYTFAKVRHYPKINEEDKTVELTFFVDPGNKTYVNRVEFRGNTQTQDEVLRRELRQMESAQAAGQKIENSKVRLERLGFFKQVESEMIPVPGEDDLVDLIYTVEEQHSGSIGASIGYADGSGLVLSANLQQNNFLGTGNKVGFGVTKNDYQLQYNFSYTNPYYTIDGVSRGWSIFYRESDFDQLGVAEYSTNSYGATLNYGYPISEIARIGFGIGYSRIKIETGFFAPQEVVATPQPYSDIDYYIERLVVDGVPQLPPTADEELKLVQDLIDSGIDPFQENEPGFIDTHGSRFNNWTINGSWRQSKLNRGLLPTDGYSQQLSLEVGVPGTDLEYVKAVYEGQYFIPIRPEWSWRFHGKFGIGRGYGDTKVLPFFKNFYAGGFGSVRGYERASLGPKGTPAQQYRTDVNRDTSNNPIQFEDLGYIYDVSPWADRSEFISQAVSSFSDPIGGNAVVETGIELIFPLWFAKDSRSLRTVLFTDAGYVYDNDCGEFQEDCSSLNLSKMRASAGLGLTWISALGPLTFSLSRPFNYTNRDDTKFFQFSIGTGF